MSEVPPISVNVILVSKLEEESWQRRLCHVSIFTKNAIKIKETLDEDDSDDVTKWPTF